MSLTSLLLHPNSTALPAPSSSTSQHHHHHHQPPPSPSDAVFELLSRGPQFQRCDCVCVRARARPHVSVAFRLCSGCANVTIEYSKFCLQVCHYVHAHAHTNITKLLWTASPLFHDTLQLCGPVYINTGRVYSVLYLLLFAISQFFPLETCC